MSKDSVQKEILFSRNFSTHYKFQLSIIFLCFWPWKQNYRIQKSKSMNKKKRIFGKIRISISYLATWANRIGSKDSVRKEFLFLKRNLDSTKWSTIHKKINILYILYDCQFIAHHNFFESFVTWATEIGSKEDFILE